MGREEQHNKSQQICRVSKEAVGSHGEAMFDRELLPSRLSWVGKPSQFFRGLTNDHQTRIGCFSTAQLSFWQNLLRKNFWSNTASHGFTRLHMASLLAQKQICLRFDALLFSPHKSRII
jgi:hypothetical protein